VALGSKRDAHTSLSEVDDVRLATSQTSGQLLQYLTTMIACTVLALVSRWDLTLIILASIPLTTVMTIVCEIAAAGPMGRERALTAYASGNVERTVNAITTVKAFNGAARELKRFRTFLATVQRVNIRLAAIWGMRIGLSGTLTLAMFTSGFAYGSHLVQSGQVRPGTVMTVFWSALLASSHLQLVIQTLSIVEKGKVAAASLRVLCESADEPARASTIRDLPPASEAGTAVESHEPGSPTLSCHSSAHSHSLPKSPMSGDEPSNFTLPPPRSAKGSARGSRTHAVAMSIDSIPHFSSRNEQTKSATGPVSRSRPPRATVRGTVAPMRKIRPSRCHGEVVLRNVTFAYPSRPLAPVLRDASMYIAAGESTYIVGASGSGKSTVAQLLTRMYDATSGTLELDDQDVRFLDPEWVRSNVASVDQAPIIFDLSVHDNVALGLCGVLEQSGSSARVGANHVPIVPREDVVAACRTALLHEFIQSLPDGYDTQLGARGASLSGGQKQRLSIARARIRDPSVLILDEATSALDPTSRLLVNEAVKAWRRGRTTVIITHDLSSVGDDDFVYLMDSGVVAQQGYRSDLGSRPGPFQALADMQMAGHGHDTEATEDLRSPTGLEARASRALEADESFDVRRLSGAQRWARGLSINPIDAPADERLRASTTSVGSYAWNKYAGGAANGRYTGAETPPVAARPGLRPLRLPQQQQQRALDEDEGTIEWLTSASAAASKRRPLRQWTTMDDDAAPPPRRKWTASELSLSSTASADGTSLPKEKGSATVLEMDELADEERDAEPPLAPPGSLRKVLCDAWVSQPYKVLLVAGFVACVAAGSVPPVFSFILGKLLATMGRQDQGQEVRLYTLIVVGLAFADGILNFLRFFVMEVAGDLWVRRLREKSYRKVLAQDKSWFDQPSSTAGAIVTSIVKDADDAQALVGRIVGQLVVVIAMVALGLIWAMVIGWQLTLVGLAFAPIFVVAMALQSRVVTKHEIRNKAKREAVAKRFYDMVANARGIRSMALEPVFGANFADAVADAERCALRAAPVSGFGFGLGEGLTYSAEALMYYVGARLIISGTYDFERMVVTFNLIIFAITFAGQVMAYLPGISKSVQAATDLNYLVSLPDATSETPGAATPAVFGGLSFENVSFAYPLRPDMTVLQSTSFNIGIGERVALVGGSGSGKSTIAALLQRLYEPASGQILLDGHALHDIDVNFLRERLAVVSQHPNLFDMSVADNIAYGAANVGTGDVPAPRLEVELAAREACAADFVEKLPSGYDTSLGENASLLSGGQAQRLAIARALMRRDAPILILDECTSALDPSTQDAVARALLEERSKHRTTLVVTHKLQLMQRCDRILVLEGGRVVEQGHYDTLIKRRGGAFAKLASAGEWGA
jgi:ATP-binding cassette subfamily B (MDR/TAP) protein 1